MSGAAWQQGVARAPAGAAAAADAAAEAAHAATANLGVDFPLKPPSVMCASSYRADPDGQYTFAAYGVVVQPELDSVRDFLILTQRPMLGARDIPIFTEAGDKYSVPRRVHIVRRSEVRLSAQELAKVQLCHMQLFSTVLPRPRSPHFALQHSMLPQDASWSGKQAWLRSHSQRPSRIQEAVERYQTHYSTLSKAWLLVPALKLRTPQSPRVHLPGAPVPEAFRAFPFNMSRTPAPYPYQRDALPRAPLPQPAAASAAASSSSAAAAGAGTRSAEESDSFTVQYALDWSLIHSALPDAFGFRARRWDDEDVVAAGVNNLLLVTEYNGLLYRFVRVHPDQTPLSAFQGRRGRVFTYRDYFRDKWGLELEPDQPMIEGVNCSTSAHDLLRPRSIKTERRAFLLPPQACYVHRLSYDTLSVLRMLPCVLWRFEQVLLADELRRRVGLNIDLRLVQQALTSTSACEGFSYERLEFLGDAVLKALVSVSVFLGHPSASERQLSARRGERVSNIYLAKCALTRGLQYLVHLAKPKPLTYVAPGFPATANKHSRPRAVSLKQLADVWEALLGAFYLTGGMGAAQQAAIFLGMRLETDATPLPRPPLPPQLPVAIERFRIVSVPALERALHYRFADWTLLLEAMTDASFAAAVTPSYQRLEFLGDAIIDHIVTEFLYRMFPNSQPASLHKLRLRLVKNNALSLSCARSDLWRHLLHDDAALSAAIARFLDALHTRRQTAVASSVSLNRAPAASPNDEIRYPEAPKVLGDIVEALIAAVFIDSGRQLAAAWRALDHLTSFKTMFERDVFAQHLESERREAEQRRELEREERASTAARKAKSRRGRSDAAAAADVAAHAAEAAAAADASAVAASSAGTAASAAAAAAAAAATQGEGAASAALLLPPPLGAQLDAFDASLAGLEDPALDDEAARGVEFGTFDAAF